MAPVFSVSSRISGVHEGPVPVRPSREADREEDCCAYQSTHQEEEGSQDGCTNQEAGHDHQQEDSGPDKEVDHEADQEAY